MSLSSLSGVCVFMGNTALSSKGKVSNFRAGQYSTDDYLGIEFLHLEVRETRTLPSPCSIFPAHSEVCFLLGPANTTYMLFQSNKYEWIWSKCQSEKSGHSLGFPFLFQNRALIFLVYLKIVQIIFICIFKHIS